MGTESMSLLLHSNVVQMYIWKIMMAFQPMIPGITYDTLKRILLGM